MAIMDKTITFDIEPAQKVFKQKVRVRPIAHHYEKKGEPKYIKWSCPICEKIAEGFPNFPDDVTFKNHSVSEGTEQCPICGINFNWDAPSFAYEHKREVTI
jgi:hypothetical protein